MKESKPNTKKSTSSRVSHKASSRTNLQNNSKQAAKANITSGPLSTDFDSWGEDWCSIEIGNEQTQGDKRSTADESQHIQWDKVTQSGAVEGGLGTIGIRTTGWGHRPACPRLLAVEIWRRRSEKSESNKDNRH